MSHPSTTRPPSPALAGTCGDRRPNLPGCPMPWPAPVFLIETSAIRKTPKSSRINHLQISNRDIFSVSQPAFHAPADPIPNHLCRTAPNLQSDFRIAPKHPGINTSPISNRSRTAIFADHPFQPQTSSLRLPLIGPPAIRISCKSHKISHLNFPNRHKIPSSTSLLSQGRQPLIDSALSSPSGSAAYPNRRHETGIRRPWWEGQL